MDGPQTTVADDRRYLFSSLKAQRVAIQEALKHRGEVAVAYDALTGSLKEAGQDAAPEARRGAQVEKLLEIIDTAVYRMEVIEKDVGNAVHDQETR